jgi:hypothetical protein
MIESSTAHPEPVEGLSFLLAPNCKKQGRGFDKLSLSGGLTWA